jgi:hypothetical protein
VCVGILLAAAASMQGLASYFEVTFHKSATPLQRPLIAMDIGKLSPEYKLNAIQPPPINEEVLASLGTEEYLQWNLDDLDVPRDDPTRLAHLFITYYDKPDAAPHNPKECYAAAGADLVDETHVTIETPGPHGDAVQIPVCVLEFARRSRSPLIGSQSDSVQVVAYFFYANGKYETTRYGVRTAIAGLRDKYAYYSKIEVSFSDARSGAKLADREETIRATRKLLRKVMPILWSDHYQDWEALKSGAAPIVVES